MSSSAELHNTQVDLSGLLQVMGKNLYSSPAVVLRELVQNAHDSIVRRRLEGDDPVERAAVKVVCRPDDHIIEIHDDGAGLTKDEIISYLATLGVGMTRKLREAHDKTELIGMFGLGFLTAYVVAQRTEVLTRSMNAPDTVWRFTSNTGMNYALSEVGDDKGGPRQVGPRQVGTIVRLTLKPEFHDLADPDLVQGILARTCCLLTLPIWLHPDGLDHVGHRINTTPPWRETFRNPAEGKRARVAFAQRFETSFEPIVAVPLDVDDEGLRGMWWVQGSGSYGTSDNRNVSVFVRRMLTDDDARDMLPRWAGFLGLVIVDDELTPTASREDLQRDARYMHVRDVVHDSIVKGLVQLSHDEPELWRRVLRRHKEALLGAAIEDDDLFEVLSAELQLPTSDGDLTMQSLRKRSGGNIYVQLGVSGGAEEMLFRARGVPVVDGQRFGAYAFCRAHIDRFGGELITLGTEAGNRSLFSNVDVDDATHDLLRHVFCPRGEELRCVRFSPTSLPAVRVVDREQQLKRKLEADDADKRMGNAVLKLARSFTKTIDDGAPVHVYVNLDSDAVQALLDASGPMQAHLGVLLRTVTELIAVRGADDEVVVADVLREFSNAVVDHASSSTMGE